MIIIVTWRLIALSACGVANCDVCNTGDETTCDTCDDGYTTNGGATLCERKDIITEILQNIIWGENPFAIHHQPIEIFLLLLQRLIKRKYNNLWNLYNLLAIMYISF